MITIGNPVSEPKTLGEFILTEINNRDISAREFAKLVGVNHRVINKFLDYGSKDVGGVSVAFLEKLAKATGTNPVTLFVLAYPEMEDGLKRLTRLSITQALRNERIEQLPDNIREAVDTIIFEHAIGKPEKDDDIQGS